MDIADSESQMSLEQKRSPDPRVESSWWSRPACGIVLVVQTRVWNRPGGPDPRVESSWWSRPACGIVLVATTLHSIAMALSYWQRAHFQNDYFYHQGIWHMCVKSVIVRVPNPMVTIQPGVLPQTPTGVSQDEIWQCASHQFHVKPEFTPPPGASPIPTGIPDIPHLFHDWLKATQAFVVLATLAGISGTFAAMSFSLLPRLHGIQYFGITAVALSLATGILILLAVIIFAAKSQKILPSPNPFVDELPDLKYDWAFGLEVLCAIGAFVPGGLIIYDQKNTIFVKYTHNIA